MCAWLGVPAAGPRVPSQSCLCRSQNTAVFPACEPLSDNRSRSCLFSCVFSPFEERLRSLSDILIHWLCFRETAVTLELRESFVSHKQSSAHCVSDNVPGSVGSLWKELKSHDCSLQGRIAAPRSGGKMQISGAGACQLKHHRLGEN